ncbi:MAG: glycosyltransferase family 2 protein, partial [Parvularculaceae bacterium]|nr:glycosyltransferase family 2 protein [Parvularculaceae bacterium]
MDSPIRPAAKVAASVGFVAIGRNEGERLVRCLDALTRLGDGVVYVDSGSTDGSLEAARRFGAIVVELDRDTPFTAARARNAGFAALMKSRPDCEFVVFIDGDCEIDAGFPQRAVAALQANPSWGVVAGRVRETDRERSVYNRLCDFEWAGPVGDVAAVGGIFMIRSRIFEKIGGFNPDVVAAEDDELCIRVRAAGYSIRRTADEMCRHDAAMTSFRQWWRRAYRAGHAYAQVGALHRGYFAGQKRRALLWGLALPASAVALAPFTAGLSLGGALALYAA